MKDSKNKRKETMADGARLFLNGISPAAIEVKLGLPVGTMARWLTRPDFDRLCAGLSGATDIAVQQQRRRVQQAAVAEVRRMLHSGHPSRVRFAITTVLKWLRTGGPRISSEKGGIKDCLE